METPGHWWKLQCSGTLTGAAKGCLGGQQASSVVKRGHTMGSLGPGALSKMGTVVSEATSRCQLAAEGHSIASLADQCQLHHSSR